MSRMRSLQKYILVLVLFPTFFTSMFFLLKTGPEEKVRVDIHRNKQRLSLRNLDHKTLLERNNRSTFASKSTPAVHPSSLVGIHSLTSRYSAAGKPHQNLKSETPNILHLAARPLPGPRSKTNVKDKLNTASVQHAPTGKRKAGIKSDGNRINLFNVSQVPSQHSGDRTPIKQCDKECKRFRRLLQRWPKGKPRAAFYYLTQRSRVDYLYKSLASVDKYFNNRFRYPIIIFIEDDYESCIPDVRKLTDSDLYFQIIEFKVPSFLTKPVVFNIPCLSHIGYRIMCRFHAKLVFKEPIIRGLDYYWRLDDDSLLLRPVEYDVFDFMRKRGLQYGYSWRHLDAMSCTEGLWDATTKYIQAHNITPYFYHDWPQPSLYYNNFEISKMGIWTSEKYSNYVDYLDKLGGIFYHRWGDAPIKGIAVSLFVPKNKTHHFKDIGYQHGSYINP